MKFVVVGAVVVEIREMGSNEVVVHIVEDKTDIVYKEDMIVIDIVVDILVQSKIVDSADNDVSVFLVVT
jgi:hypothetical protein